MNTHLLSTSKLLVSLLLCILASSPPFWAKEFRSITGGVYDATGAVIPGVRITAIGLETGLQHIHGDNHRGQLSHSEPAERRVPCNDNLHRVQDVHSVSRSSYRRKPSQPWMQPSGSAT